MDIRGWNGIQPFLIQPPHSVPRHLSLVPLYQSPQRDPQSILISQLKMQKRSHGSPLKQCFACHGSYKKAQILNTIHRSLLNQVQSSHSVSIPSLFPWVFQFQSLWVFFQFSQGSKLLFPLVLELHMVCFLWLDQWTYLSLVNLCFSFIC